MKAFILIFISVLLLEGCAHKPPVPEGNRGKYEIVSTKVLHKQNKVSSRETIVKDNIPPEILRTPSDIFDKYSSAVFKIHTSTINQQFQGSGFFISDDGIAVSNYHVFENTAVGYENILLSTGKQYKVSHVYYKSKTNDFIIFKVAVKSKVNYIPLANKTPRVGEKVYTIGSPRGLDNTFSSGEISQIREGGAILQISAPIDHGSSGGVLLNIRGEAIGITSGGIDGSGANLNYARNINLIKPYIP